jgi:hypothetical protein
MSVSWYGVTVTVEAALTGATLDSYGLWNVDVWDDPEALWGPDAVWTDISQYVRSLTTKRGFSRAVQAWEAGTFTVELDNRDGRFSPANLGGPYVAAGVSQVRPGRPVRIRIAYGGTTRDVITGYSLGWKESFDLADALPTVKVPCADALSVLARYNGLEQPPLARVSYPAGGYTGSSTTPTTADRAPSTSDATQSRRRPSQTTPSRNSSSRPNPRAAHCMSRKTER